VETGGGIAIGAASGTTTVTTGVAIGGGFANATDGVAVGNASSITTGVAIGNSTAGTTGVAIGFTAVETAGGIELGAGTNTTAGLAINGHVITTGTGDLLIVTAAPASSSATGLAGQIAYDGSFFYVCVAANTWVRAPLSTW
jgi:hypothetical protein